jgi:hypothetical protein
MQQRRTGSNWMWLPDAVVAALVPSLVMWNLLGWLAEDRCLDAGGRVIGGVEKVCELQGGQVTPLSLGFTPVGWLALAGLWIGMAAAVYWSARRWMSRRGDTNSPR